MLCLLELCRLLFGKGWRCAEQRYSGDYQHYREIDPSYFLFGGNHRRRGRRRQRMLLGLLESSPAQHVLELFKSVGIACGRGRQHDEAEASHFRRRNAIRIWNKLDDRDAAARTEGGMHSFQKDHAGWRIEVMKKIRDEHDIVILSQIDLERASRNHAKAIRETGGLCVSARYFQHRRPIERNELRLRILLRDRDSIYSVPGGDVEDS